MFGKPEWFREKTWGWGLSPIAWQGWLYALGWMAVLLTPFLLLIYREQPIQAGVWMLVMLAGMFADVRSIIHAGRLASKRSSEPLLYFNDDDSPMATKHFDLHLRR